MSDEEIKTHLQELIEIYGDQLPSPIHQPMEFRYIVKLYFYDKARGE